MSATRRSLPEVAPAIAFSVEPYTEDTLAAALSNDWVNKAAVAAGQRFNFLREYLGPAGDGLHAQTMVQERPYVSQSYLEDYAHYYAHCFAPYERDCVRVHFFSHPFDQEQLLAALAADDTHDIWRNYLGYIVVKPIPSPVGATLLRPYPNGAQNERHYPVQRPYQVNLLGKKLTVPTLIWQQQDTNVSACATTALWMAFHKTAFLFQTPLPSPYRITESAGNLFNHSGRTFPNQGLDAFQIMTAVQSVGLVSELRTKFPHPTRLVPEERAFKEKELKALIYAYLRFGLPVLLFIDFEQQQGAHLIAATGYRRPEPGYVYAATSIGTGHNAGRYPALYSDGIVKLYAHDDGVGPYARLTFDPATSLVFTAWPKGSAWHQAHLYTVVVPLTEMVRITYEQVYRQAALLDLLLEFLQPWYAPATAPVVWDIYLQESNAHKEETLAGQDGTTKQRERIATRLLPKYVWVARALYQGRALMELVFDATDLHTGFYCLLTTTYAPLRQPLTQLLPTDTFQGVVKKLVDSRYVGLLLEDLALLPPTAP